MRANIAAVVGSLVAWHAACIAAAARVQNKGASTIRITVWGDDFDADQSVLGAKMAADEINARADLLPDATIVIDSNMAFYSRYDAAYVFDVAVDNCNTPGQVAHYLELASVTAGQFSLVCQNIPGVSFVSGGPFLSDKQLYPMFWRYAAPLSVLIRASLSYYQYFGWTKIGLVYEDSWIWPKLAKYYREFFGEHGIDVVGSVSIPAYTGSGDYYSQIKANFEYLRSTKLRVFAAVASSETCIDVMMAANKTGLVGRNYVWNTVLSLLIVPDDFEQKWGEPTFNATILRGMTQLATSIGPFLDDPTYQAWLSRFTPFVANAITNTPQLYPFLDLTNTDPTSQFNPQNFFYDDPGDNQYPAIVLIAAYDATFAMVNTWEKWIRDANSDGPTLASGALNAKFNLADMIAEASKISNPLSGYNKFTAQGDAIPQKISLNVNDGRRVYPFNKAGQLLVNVETGLANLTLNTSAYLWNGDRLLNDVPIDFPPEIVDFVSWTAPGTRSILALSGIVGIVCAAMSTYLAVHARHKILMPFAPDKLVVVGIGLILMLFNVLTLVGKDKPIACALRPWPLSLGLALVLLPIINKHYLIYIIFRIQQTRVMVNAVRVRWILQVASTAIMCLLITLLLVLSLTAPYKSKEVYLEESDSYVWTCVTTSNATQGLVSTIIAINSVLFVIATALVYLNRNLPAGVNDVKETTNSLYIFAVFGLVVIAQAAFGTASVTTQFFIEAVAVLASTIGMSLMLLGTPLLSHLSRVYSGLAYVLGLTALESSRNRGSRSFSKREPRQVSHRPVQQLQQDGESATPSVGSVNVPSSSKSTQETVTKITCAMSCKRALLLESGYFANWQAVSLTLIGEPVYQLRIINKRSQFEEADFLPILDVESVQVKTSEKGKRQIVQLGLAGSLRLTIQFSDEAMALQWADTIAFGLIRLRNPDRLQQIDSKRGITNLVLGPAQITSKA